MASPAYFGKLLNFTAAVRKQAFIPFGSFSPNDNLSFIASLPGSQIVPPSTIAYSAALIIDSSLADVSVLLTGNVTSTTLNYGGSSSIPIGTRLYIRYQQNSTGGWTVVLPTSLVIDTGFAVDPTPSRTTVLPIEWNGTNWVFFSSPFSVTGS